ncbi:fasciclin domain-containing protein [Luteolibacter algae]|uniref:Fasciclin domain-containing protein n=1 Tax=Luteolibacter algae TaxID=454151 RepID=A0ABW5DAP7_9BACT
MKNKNITQIALALSIAAVTPIAFAQEAGTADKKMEEKAMPEIKQGSLTNVIADSVTFKTLSAALKAAELDVTLGGNDNFTIFAPTDEAFQKLPEGTLQKLLLPENKEKLRSLLLYHVIAGNVMVADLKDDQKVKTMNGELLEIDIDGDEVKANDSKVYSVDTMATNGVMHSVGEVIVPESLDDFAGLED